MKTIGFAMLVHELQSRVATIAVFSDLLLVDAQREDPGWVHDRLKRINCAAAEMQRVIETVKRLEAGADLQLERIDVTALCTEMLKRFVERSPKYRRAAVRIQSNIEVDGDSSEIEIVLENLLGNALKFSSCRSSPEVHVTSRTEAGRAIVSISDNGIGIAPEDAERVFEPFTRCHPGFEGSGIGLALVSHIVRRHGGHVWAQGELGVGATVSFRV